MNEDFIDILRDVETLARSIPEITNKDIDRIYDIVKRIDVKEDTIDDDMSVHMELEVELAWLRSKTEYLSLVAQAAYDNYKSSLISESRNSDKKIPSWAIQSITESDSKSILLQDRMFVVKRLHSFIDNLARSMMRRETIIENVCKRNRIAGQ